jgi:putative ABC transport system substrate-binding protein
VRRREFVAGLAGAAVWPLVARAQSASKRWTIGLLASSPLPPIERLKRKLHELGYIEGENVHLDARFAEGRDDLYPKLAAELVGKNADVLIAWGTPAALAAKHATTRIPIVLVAGDVLNTGLVANLARPEGNITGFIAANVDLEEKRLDTLREIVPNLKRIGILAMPETR